MLIAILLGFLFSLFLVFTGKFFRGKPAILSAAVPLGLFIYFAGFINRVADGEVITQHYNWIPSFGVNLGFTLDGLSLLFSLMITGIGFLVFIYTSSYLKNHKYLDRFYGYLSMFMAAMLGLVLSDNLISLFVFWELTSISSFFLIGFNNNNKDSRKSAIVALAITGLGGLSLLAGAIIIGAVGGTYSIAELLSGGLIADSPYYILICILIFGAAFTKSAQFPFHFWLPSAMKAPTPVSTYLHSATMVKAGIYLLMRLTPLLGGQDFWNYTLITVGAITMVYAAVHTLFRIDLKGILAYSTISALGILVFLIGQGTHDAFLAAALFIVVHALYKATLFLVTGIIDHQTGTRDMTVLRGLRKVLFPVAIAGFLAAISSAGIPPGIGFIGKEMTYESTLHSGDSVILVMVLIVITKILLLYAGFVAGIKPFFGKLPENFEKVKMPGFLLWMPPLFLALLGILFGAFPMLIDTSIIAPAVTAMGGDGSQVHLELWHGFTLVLLLSAITIIVGLVLYFKITPTERLNLRAARFEFISPREIFQKLWNWFNKLSGLWTDIFQNGYLSNYISVIVVFMIALTGYTLYNTATFSLDLSTLSEITVYEMVTVVILLVAVFYTVFTRSRVAAVASMGIVGLAVALLFVFYSAPDLAMTQFSIDTLTVILFVLVLYRLPKYLQLSDYKTRLKDGVLALGFGTIITIIVLEVLSVPVDKQISQFYGENAYTLAKGKNVVNVILVDFRGSDTFMEIAVLTIAAIGVFGLLKLRLKDSDPR